MSNIRHHTSNRSRKAPHWATRPLCTGSFSPSTCLRRKKKASLRSGDPESSLTAIDRLEGFHQGDSSLYRRVLVPVCTSGQIIPAWVYVGAPRHREQRFLPSGIWPE
ncbi:MAG: gamma-glutamylcyclotransferase [Deltaproteobacteria bacterium]|nr:gamma-glutamylcyclotransferase [Deltaproteobacteria bacterium]